MKKNSTEPDCPYCHGIDQTPLIYLWNVQMLNRFGINLQSGTTKHVRKHCFGAKRYYLWCFKIPIVLFNSESLDHNWKIFLYIKGIHDEKRHQFTDFVTLVNEKN